MLACSRCIAASTREKMRFPIVFQRFVQCCPAIAALAAEGESHEMVVLSGVVACPMDQGEASTLPAMGG